jgi:hypothetical protein
MNYKEVKQELKNEFENFLKPLGYKSKNGLQGCRFYKSIDFSAYIIGYGIANYIDEFTTGVFIVLQIEKIGLLQCRIHDQQYEKYEGGGLLLQEQIVISMN